MENSHSIDLARQLMAIPSVTGNELEVGNFLGIASGGIGISR